MAEGSVLSPPLAARDLHGSNSWHDDRFKSLQIWCLCNIRVLAVYKKKRVTVLCYNSTKTSNLSTDSTAIFVVF